MFIPTTKFHFVAILGLQVHGRSNYTSVSPDTSGWNDLPGPSLLPSPPGKFINILLCLVQVSLEGFPTSSPYPSSLPNQTESLPPPLLIPLRLGL